MIELINLIVETLVRIAGSDRAFEAAEAKKAIERAYKLIHADMESVNEAERDRERAAREALGRG